MSHERCIRAIRKELPALIITLQQLYEEGDTEAYGFALVLHTFSGVASVILLSEVLDLLAKLSCFMQKNATDFSRLSTFIDSTLDELKNLLKDGAEWQSDVCAMVSKLKTEHGLTIRERSTRSGSTSPTTVGDFCRVAAVPYIEALVANITKRFSDKAVELLTSSSVFIPSSFPADKEAFSD